MDGPRWLVGMVLAALLGVVAVGSARAQEPEVPPQLGAPVPIDAPTETPRRNYTDNLPYRPIPPLGNYPVLPSGPGYYSLMDVLTGNYRQAPPPSAYPLYALMRNSMFEADYRYLDNPDYVSEDFFDRFHNVHVGDWLLGTGGQFDSRYMHQDNARLSGTNDDYDLLRVRIYGDAWYKDLFRFYAEIISSGSTNQELTPLKIDRMGTDFLNLFVGIKIADIDDHPAYLRVGRQELLIGSERLVTPLEWGNTRQTFQGVHALWSNNTLDFDGWWTEFVPANPAGLSSPDPNQTFSGAWVAYHPDKKIAVDFYWLLLHDTDKVSSMGIPLDPTTVNTFGTRFVGEKNNFLWDFEPDIQCGYRGSQQMLAGAASGGLGYALPQAPLEPTFWAYYDWASGSSHPGVGDDHTFNQLYGFGHYYLGFMDLIGRENIRDLNFQTYLYPTKWLTLNVQYHILSLDSAKDALYGPLGTPSRVSPLGTAGKDVGEELTFSLNVHIGPHSDILTGFSHLYAGEFIRNTTTSATGKFSPEMVYLMYNVRW